jgi:hypothetical protein
MNPAVPETNSARVMPWVFLEFQVWAGVLARSFDCRARSFEFDLLDPVGGQDDDLAALPLV